MVEIGLIDLPKSGGAMAPPGTPRDDTPRSHAVPARVLRQFGAVIQFLRETIIHIKCASVGSFSPACRRAFLLIKTVCKIKFHPSNQIFRNLFKDGILNLVLAKGGK